MNSPLNEICMNSNLILSFNIKNFNFFQICIKIFLKKSKLFKYLQKNSSKNVKIFKKLNQ